jgi:hypothetical protein
MQIKFNLDINRNVQLQIHFSPKSMLSKYNRRHLRYWMLSRDHRPFDVITPSLRSKFTLPIHTSSNEHPNLQILSD